MRRPTAAGPDTSRTVQEHAIASGPGESSLASQIDDPTGGVDDDASDIPEQRGNHGVSGADGETGGRFAAFQVDVVDRGRRGLGAAEPASSASYSALVIAMFTIGSGVTASGGDPVLVTSRITEIEVRRNLARLLDGDSWTDSRRQLAIDLDAFALIALDATTCNEAAAIAERTGCRSLDALHLGAAIRAGASTTLLTFDVRQAQAARTIGLAVVGV